MNQERAFSATNFLIETAEAVGAAKAEAVRATAMLRHIKALAMKASGESAVSAQEREAYASDEYLAAITAEFEAVKAFESLKARREAAQATIETWRSANANQRAAERGYGSHP